MVRKWSTVPISLSYTILWNPAPTFQKGSSQRTPVAWRVSLYTNS
jgi:hypothetical protein